MRANRIGKMVWCETDGNGPDLGLHLGMAGRITINEEPHDRWDRFALTFEDGTRMALRDKRRLGRAILAVSQDPGALRLVGGNPVKVKEIAFGLSIATAVVAGALLIIIQPVEPSLGREYIGRVFAICVLGGMTSLGGTVLASIILGIAEALTATWPSFTPT